MENIRDSKSGRERQKTISGRFVLLFCQCGWTTKKKKSIAAHRLRSLSLVDASSRPRRDAYTPKMVYLRTKWFLFGSRASELCGVMAVLLPLPSLLPPSPLSEEEKKKRHHTLTKTKMHRSYSRELHTRLVPFNFVCVYTHSSIYIRMDESEGSAPMTDLRINLEWLIYHFTRLHRCRCLLN